MLRRLRTWLMQQPSAPEVKVPLQLPIGPKWRPHFGDCPGCGRDQQHWCAPSCDYVDSMDYR